MRYSFNSAARVAAVLAFVGFTALAGCSARNEVAQAAAAAPAPQVTVAQVVAKKVTDFDEFTGRFEAVERVEIRPRVAGYIASVDFAEGKEVKKGDVLFVIDQRPYAADLKRAQAQLTQAKSQLALAKSEKERATKMLAAHAISQEEYDTRAATDEQAVANIQAAEAAVDTAALNLSFTKITAPISGRVSRALVTQGNLVTNGQTLLTTVVSVDPIYVTFDGDEQVYLKYAKLARLARQEALAAKTSKANSKSARHGRGNDPSDDPSDDNRGGAQDVGQQVRVGLADENGYPHDGVLVFEDNELDSATGTIRVRARLQNTDRLFTPGLFARVKMLGGEQYNAILINDSAVGTDQTVKYVLVVGADNKVQYRPIKLGPVIDGLRVVSDGLKDGETIVVNGLQRVRPGAQISPQKVAMGERSHQPDTPMLARNAKFAQNDTASGKTDTASAAN